MKQMKQMKLLVLQETDWIKRGPPPAAPSYGPDGVIPCSRGM